MHAGEVDVLLRKLALALQDCRPRLLPQGDAPLLILHCTLARRQRLACWAAFALPWRLT